MKKETLSSIAARIGVSATTVSRVLRGDAEKYRISDSTRDKVLEEAHRCMYIPNASAQNLRNSGSGIIGLLIPSISNPFFAEMASVIVTKLREQSYTTIVIDTMENDNTLIEGVESLISRQVEGIIAAPSGIDASALERLGHKVPIVLIDRYYENTTLPYVTTNNFQGAFLATVKLISAGYREIACIQGTASSMPNKERIHGYRDAMQKNGLEENCKVVGNDFTIQNGYLETKLLLNSPVPPKAIFALSNTIMLGALKAIKESGLDIPSDIALLSFDDNMYMDYLTPSIARVGQPTADMSTLAVKILMDKLSGRSDNHSQIKLLPTFIPGASI